MTDYISDEAFQLALDNNDIDMLTKCVEARLAAPAIPGTRLMLRSSVRYPHVVSLLHKGDRWVRPNGGLTPTAGAIAKRLLAQYRSPLPKTLCAINEHDVAAYDGADADTLARTKHAVIDAFCTDLKAMRDPDLSCIRKALKTFAPLR